MAVARKYKRKLIVDEEKVNAILYLFPAVFVNLVFIVILYSGDFKP